MCDINMQRIQTDLPASTVKALDCLAEQIGVPRASLIRLACYKLAIEHLPQIFLPEPPIQELFNSHVHLPMNTT